MIRGRNNLAMVKIVLLSLGLALSASGCGSPRSGQPRKDANGASNPAQTQPQPVRILANQVGYEAAGAKRAVIQGHAGDVFASFAVKTFPGGETVLTGTPKHDGPVAKW